MSFAHAATRIAPRAAASPRRWLVLALSLSLLIGAALPSAVAAHKSSWLASDIPPLTVALDSEAGRLITIAEQHIGARWQYSAIGPNRFDCSGLIYFAFREAGLFDRIGSRRVGATSYRNYFANLGLRSGGDISTALPGDILIWGHGEHSGIYLGDNWAISTLINPYGVRIHGVDRLNVRLTDVLHVQLSREAPAS